MIINHDHREYRRRWRIVGKNKFNGAFYYSKEICKNIIPRVRTDRNWITVNLPGYGADHSIVFVHNNLHPENYDWLSKYDDIVLVCGVPETVEKVAHLGKAIYLPLSIDTEYVDQFRLPAEDRSGTAFVGRPAKRTMPEAKLPAGIRFIEGTPRGNLLAAMARCESVYAVGRCALEAKQLGVEVLPYDSRYPDPEIWQVLDNSEAAEILQRKLNEIDHPEWCQRLVDIEPAKDESPAETVTVPTMDWTKAELIAYAEDQGIEVKAKDTKQKIIDKIEEAKA